MIMTTAALHVLVIPLPTKKTQEAAVPISDVIALAGECEGYQVASVKIVELAAGHRCMEIELTPETLGLWSVPVAGSRAIGFMRRSPAISATFPFSMPRRT